MDAEPPNNSAETCGTCGKDVSLSVANGRAACPYCGQSILPPLVSGMSRGWLWVLFWAIFLGTPVGTFMSLQSAPSQAITVMATGLLFAASILSILFFKTAVSRIAMTLVFAIFLVVVYGGIAFAGCLALIATNGKGLR